MEKLKNIKHLVICGGLIYGFIFYGILHELCGSNPIHIDMNNIKSIHATSVGALLASILTLKDDWKILEKYFIERPWTDIFNLSMSNILQCYKSCGIFNQQVFIKLLRPIFSANDLDIEKITMKELYDHTKIDLFIYTTNVEHVELVPIHWKTHPSWRVLDAIYASSNIPIIFQPYKEPISKQYYVDGGTLSNYPIGSCVNHCIEVNDELDTIFGIQMELKDGCGELLNDILNNQPNLLDYIYMLVNKTIFKFTEHFYPCNISKLKNKEEDNVEKNPIEIFVKTDKYSLDIMPLIKDKDKRIEFINLGKKYAKDFIKLHEINDISGTII